MVHPADGDELSLFLTEPVPYLVTDGREEMVPAGTSLAYTMSLAVCALAVAGAAMRRPVVQANRRLTSPPFMVSWAEAPADLKWAEAAWNYMQLDAKDLSESCIWIPPGYAPDESLEWYFCSTQAANESGVSCFSLPMRTAGRNVYICSMRKGARPAYYE
jgi:hypothetical protein